MYECIRLEKSELDDSVLEAEGPVDEWDDGMDEVTESAHSRTSSIEADSGGSNSGQDPGSPIDID